MLFHDIPENTARIDVPESTRLSLSFQRICQFLRIFEPIGQFQPNLTLGPVAQKYYIPINFIGSDSSTEEKNPNQHPYSGKSGLFGSVIDTYVSSSVNTSLTSSLTAGKQRPWAEAEGT